MRRVLKRSLQSRPKTWMSALGVAGGVLLDLAAQDVLQGRAARAALIIGGALLGWAFGPSPGMVRIPQPPKGLGR